MVVPPKHAAGTRGLLGPVSDNVYVERGGHVRLGTRKSDHYGLPTVNEQQKEIYKVDSSKTAGVSDER